MALKLFDKLFHKKKTPETVYLRINDVDKTNFYFKEAYNKLAVNLMYTVSKHGCKTIMVTSAHATNGKSLDSYNTAATFAKSGKKVLILDMDLRKPTQDRYCRVEKECGMTDLLCGMSKVNDVIKHCKDTGVDVITSGKTAVNPVNLLVSPIFAEVMTEIKALDYDWIIIDTPPLGVVSDALLIIPHTDGVVLVVNKQESTYPDIKETISAIKLANGNIIGTVLNNDDGDGDTYRGHKYYRRYGYKRYYSYYNSYYSSRSDEEEKTEDARAKAEDKGNK